ncbi:MAG: pyridoxamine 5'-phosphate oxidase family protein [Muribaculaceae bacterium]|nr:pyridoxamine 5'-phosphate oxidase family protein [Muribaculaceae bacterium]
MRRFNQELPESEINRILQEGKYAVIALDGDEYYPYAVPVNYVYDGEAIYLHSASTGHKTDSIRRNPRCSICVVDKDDVIPEEFTSYFRSVIAFGHAKILDREDEKIKILRMLSDKYSPGIDPTDEISRFIKTVCIIRIDIDSISGKEAIELSRQRRSEK